MVCESTKVGLERVQLDMVEALVGKALGLFWVVRVCGFTAMGDDAELGELTRSWQTCCRDGGGPWPEWDWPMAADQVAKGRNGKEAKTGNERLAFRVREGQWLVDV